MRDLVAHKTKVDPRPDRSQRMIGPHASIQINLITEELLLPIVLSHHITKDRRFSFFCVQSSR